MPAPWKNLLVISAGQSLDTLSGYPILQVNHTVFIRRVNTKQTRSLWLSCINKRGKAWLARFAVRMRIPNTANKLQIIYRAKIKRFNGFRRNVWFTTWEWLWFMGGGYHSCFEQPISSMQASVFLTDSTAMRGHIYHQVNLFVNQITPRIDNGRCLMSTKLQY